MTTLSTHVLDAALGVPAAGLPMKLHHNGGTVLAEAVTDVDGRVHFDVELGGGLHALIFATGSWFAASDRSTFFPAVHVAFDVDPDEGHYHVALLLSPFSYTTYRGS